MDKKNYKWKIESFSKKIDANKVVDELNRIESKNGLLNPISILNEARNENSILHPLFEWDNNKAAEQYRLQQARNIINNIEIIIVSDSENFKIPVYEIITDMNNNRCYKHIQSLSFDEIEQVKKNTLESLSQISRKLKMYKNFKVVLQRLEDVVYELSIA